MGVGEWNCTLRGVGLVSAIWQETMLASPVSSAVPPAVPTRYSSGGMGGSALPVDSLPGFTCHSLGGVRGVTEVRGVD